MPTVYNPVTVPLLTGTETTTGTGMTVATFATGSPSANLSASVFWTAGTTTVSSTPGTITPVGQVFVPGIGQTEEYLVTTTATFGQSTGANQPQFSVDIHDATDDTTAVAIGTMQVLEAPLTLFDTNPGPGATEGVPLSSFNLERFTDGNTSATVADFQGTIDWGDGSPASPASFSIFGGAFLVSGNHTYFEAPAGPITITVQDKDYGGSLLSAMTGPVTFTDPVLTPAAATAVTATEGAALNNVQVATFTDPNTLALPTDFGVSVTDWGDSTSGAASVVETSVDSGGAHFAVLASHTYTDPLASGNISVSIQDLDSSNAAVTATTPVVVNAGTILPTATPVVVAEAATIPTGTAVGSFIDAGGADGANNYTASVTFAGATGATTLTVTQEGASNRYTLVTNGATAFTNPLEEGVANFTLSIIDLDGNTATTTGMFTVTDVAAAATGGFTVHAVEGADSGAQTVATFTDPGGPEAVGDYSATITWGDGTAADDTGVISVSGSTFTVKGHHTYAEESAANHAGSNPYQVTVVIHHAGALDSNQVTSTAMASDPAAVATGGFTVNAVEGADSGAQTVATFTDPGGLEAVGDYSATIDWGDGSALDNSGAITLSGTTFTVAGHHTYLTSGVVPIAVTIHHEGAPDSSVAASSANISGDVVVNGTAGDDALVVERTSGKGVGSITYVLNGATVTLTGVTSFTFNGQGGNDTMTVTKVNGGPLVPGDIHFDGGAGNNTLIVDAAGAVTRETQGNVTFGDPQNVTYVNAGAINLNNAASAVALYGPDTADRGTAFAVLTAQERFVQALYLDALGRAGTKAELDGWVALFNTPGQTQAQDQSAIAAGIEHSAEARDHLVKSWYVTFLGRPASGGEEQVWVNALQAGQTEETVLSAILSSTEFYNRAQTLISTGSADERYVQALYLLLLNRTGEASAVSAWVGALSGGRQGVVLSFLKGTEFRTDQFEAYYNALLHRPDDAAGLNGWVFSNLDMDTVRIGFESTDEFFTNG